MAAIPEKNRSEASLVQTDESLPETRGDDKPDNKAARVAAAVAKAKAKAAARREEAQPDPAVAEHIQSETSQAADADELETDIQAPEKSTLTDMATAMPPAANQIPEQGVHIADSANTAASEVPPTDADTLKKARIAAAVAKAKAKKAAKEHE